MTDGLEQVRDALRKFAADRDWFQYHNPKNLTMALGGEVGELSALFQWLTLDEAAATASDDHPQRSQVEDELADVFVYLIRLADELHVDLVGAALRKIERNEARFPATSR